MTTKYYNSIFYSKPIKVENIDGEIIVIIIDKLNRKIIYTWYDIKENKTNCKYINKCLLGGFIKKIPKNILVIGCGGGAFINFLEYHIKDVNITGIDIDKTMIEIAKKELNVKTNDFYIGDAKLAIKEIIKEKKKYDLVLIDVYGSDGEIPQYFEETIFFENIKKVLLKEAVISINFSNYDLKNKEKNTKYNLIHSSLINTFGKYYSHILSGENNKGNIAGIYNLDRFYEAKEYDINYIKNYRLGNIIYNSNIIENTILI